MSGARILSMGEALVDVLPAPDGLRRAAPGGSSYNVALALAAFSAPVAFVGRLSTDEEGEAMRARLVAAGCDVTRVARDPRPSPLSWVRRAGVDMHPRFDIYLEGTAHAPPALAPDWLDGAAHLHVSSFSAVAGAWGEAVFAALETARGRVSTSFDVNIRPALLPPREEAAARIEARVARVDLVKASDDDLAWLYPDEPPEAVARRWAQDARMVLLTRGETGASLLRGDERPDCAAPRVALRDTVGAGDACLAGFLTECGRAAALDPGHLAAASHETLARALRFATFAGALTCERDGADAPPRAEVEAALSRAGR